MVDARYPRAGGSFSGDGSYSGLIKSPSLASCERCTDTPRNPDDACVKVWNAPPMSPAHHKRTKSRASHLTHRTSSLTESKVGIFIPMMRVDGFH